MKLMTVTTAKAMLLVETALKHQRADMAVAELQLDAKREEYITKKVAGAWFHKQRSYWENRWEYTGDCALSQKWYAQRDLSMFWVEDRIWKIEKLELRIKHLQSEGIRELTLENDELIWLYVPAKEDQ